MSCVQRIAGGLLCFSILHLGCGAVFSAEPFDGLKAGAEAYSRSKAAGRGAIRRQVGRNQDMRYRAGLPSAIDGTFRFSHPPTLESWYAFGPRARRRVFAPWHYVPGDIWGYRSPIGADLRQPIDQRQVQTGENLWESFPTYAPYDYRRSYEFRRPTKKEHQPIEETQRQPALEPPALKPPPLEPPVEKRRKPRSL